jgi:hypothetical protein
MFFQQRDQLHFKTPPLMMSLLIFDVSRHRRHQRSTHTERRITLLPCKFHSLQIRPSRRIRFDLADRFSHRQPRGHLQKEMYVIVHPANCSDENSLVRANPDHVGPYSALKVPRHNFAPVFRAEYNVNYILIVCVGQCVAPTALCALHIKDPALTGWANTSRTYGAPAHRQSE